MTLRSPCPSLGPRLCTSFLKCPAILGVYPHSSCDKPSCLQDRPVLKAGVMNTTHKRSGDNSVHDLRRFDFLAITPWAIVFFHPLPKPSLPLAHPWNSCYIFLLSSFQALASLSLPIRKDLESLLWYQVSHLHLRPICVHVLRRVAERRVLVRIQKAVYGIFLNQRVTQHHQRHHPFHRILSLATSGQFRGFAGVPQRLDGFHPAPPQLLHPGKAPVPVELPIGHGLCGFFPSH